MGGKPRLLNLLQLLCLLVLLPFSLATGVADFDWRTLWAEPQQLALLLDSRLPRTLAVILVGATLGVAGMVMQMLLKNRFIEPTMIGATQSVALGILIVSLCFPGASLFAKMSVASLFALGGMVLFSILVYRLAPQQQLLVPLLGIVFGNVIESATTFVAYQTDALQMLSAWFTGDFSGILVGRYELLWLTAALALLIYFMADQLSIMSLGKNLCYCCSLLIAYCLLLIAYCLLLIASVYPPCCSKRSPIT
ncbi:iron chelate uptake ABC transporter family permease subunit [[Haemophilus] felis]|nr:iron chelate uptake ABC transporter family permease subunit [[Haemophilus] felis]